LIQKFVSKNSRWTAIENRDPTADGRFYYGVTSTGVYCRPSCSSRRPKRQNVEFFTRIEAAEQAGYRPCKRCRPQGAHPGVDLVERVCSLIDKHGGEPLTLQQLSERMHVSPFHLQKSFKHILGMSPSEYQHSRRLDRLKISLRQGKNVTGAIYQAGFGSSSAAYGKTPAALGMSPATYRKGGKGLLIRYTIVDTDLGKLLIAMTPAGICRVDFGESSRVLEQALRKEFFQAELYADANGLNHCIKQLKGHLSGNPKILDLPLDIQSTAFQRKVWVALQQIPYAQTRSYSQVAAELGVPKAVRAVARACAQNPVALLIPCHRVISKTGKLTGYRWGLQRKKVLLASEKKK
jgi:AraC family transcriptional regulator of adaptative response/methylated-DNA-[protein]-cysteine methyltransferase